MLGQKVATVFEGKMDAGVYQSPFSGRNLATGMYILRLTTEKNTLSVVKKIMLVK